MTSTPTKPHEPISALHSTSGPLFELEHGKYKDGSSSGVDYSPNPKISQTGKDKPQQYSLNAQRDNPEDNLNPGPGAYSPEREFTMRAAYRSSPAYSLTARHDYSERYTNAVPGPGAYSVPDVRVFKQQAPAYSLGVRHSWSKAPFIVEYKE